MMLREPGRGGRGPFPFRSRNSLCLPPILPSSFLPFFRPVFARPAAAARSVVPFRSVPPSLSLSLPRPLAQVDLILNKFHFLNNLPVGRGGGGRRGASSAPLAPSSLVGRWR